MYPLKFYRNFQYISACLKGRHRFVKSSISSPRKTKKFLDRSLSLPRTNNYLIRGATLICAKHAHSLGYYNTLCRLRGQNVAKYSARSLWFAPSAVHLPNGVVPDFHQRRLSVTSFFDFISASTVYFVLFYHLFPNLSIAFEKIFYQVSAY